ncbi:MAG: 23S rRNA (uracil(1939)-C(5))-methyltransferase RlmD [Woeseiaceae bacterium]
MKHKRREPETANIVSATHDGRGIADTEGKKVFVAGALEGEQVQFLRRKFHRRFDEAELLEILEPSPHRIEAKCAAFGRCGGCSLQHMSAERQRQIKFQTLQDNLARIGNVDPQEWLEPMIGPEWNYRRRARLAVKHVHGKGRVLVGFRERLAPFVTDMHRCEVLVEPLDAMIEPLSDMIAGLSISARIPQIEVAVAENAIALVFRVLEPPTADDKATLIAFATEHDVRVYLQPGGLNTVELLHPAQVIESLHYTLPDFDITVHFEPVDFVQINAEINRRMVQTAIDYLDVQPGDRVLDLYCGIGNFSLPLARRAAEVLGIEGEASLVRRATENAERNGLHNVAFETADLSKIDGSESWHKPWDKVLLDPARSGAADVVERMPALAPRQIVYVSCHPGTLARDAGVLVTQHGYTLQAAGIIDMFPHTAHVESIAIFRK